MLKRGAEVGDPQISMEEDRRRAANHGAVQGAHHRCLQASNDDKASDGIEQTLGSTTRRRWPSLAIWIATSTEDAAKASNQEIQAISLGNGRHVQAKTDGS